jgi:hypothetical protein
MLGSLTKKFSKNIRKPRRIPARLRLFQPFFVGNSEFPPALRPAAGQHLAAIFRLNTGAETVFVLARPAGRLVCAFLCHLFKIFPFKKSERKGKFLCGRSQICFTKNLK